MLAAMMVAPVAIAAPALAASGDADILAAWQRMVETRAAIDALGDDDVDRDNALWEAFGRDEKQIQSVVASSLIGAEIQLWCCLLHSVPTPDDEAAVIRRDFSWFVDRDSQQDWTARLIFSAIRSLRAQG
jgi:hypothetical protein